MYILATSNWFIKLIRIFFFSIDKIIYNTISAIYDLLIVIARTSIFSQADIANFADRIYKFLAVFMIFKVTLSLITYAVNPDDFSDKQKGVGKLLQNSIITLGLLVLTPYFFSYAYKLQTIVLEDNTLATILLADDNDDYSNALGSAGDIMAFTTMSAFFSPDVAVAKLYNCSQLYISDNGVKTLNKDCFGLNEKYEKVDASNSGVTLYSLTEANSKEFSDVTLKNYVAGMKNKNLGLMFRQNLVTATVKDNNETYFVMDYKFIFSTVLGIVLILILLTYCMDIAVRSIKLGFLQLIAPIPIISYIDPKSGKDGLFKKWYEMCFKTYISLFIRLIAIYFVIMIVSKIDSLTDIVDGSEQNNLFIKLFMIIGVLMFAKQLPKMLEGLGVKLDGGFTLNPLKKLEKDAALGKNITGAVAGAATGFLGNKGARRLSGMMGGLARGGLEGKGSAEAKKRQADVNRKLRQARLNGTTYFGRLNESYGAVTGAETNSERYEQRKKSLESEKKFNDANLSFAKGVRSHILDDLENKKISDFDSMPAWQAAQSNLREAQANYQGALNSNDAKAIKIAKDELAIAQDAAVSQVLNSGEEDGYIKAEREKYNVRIRNNQQFAGGQKELSTGELSASTQKKIKDDSQKKVNQTDMALYEVSESSQASQYQGDKTASEAKKITPHLDGLDGK